MNWNWVIDNLNKQGTVKDVVDFLTLRDIKGSRNDPEMNPVCVYVERLVNTTVILDPDWFLEIMGERYGLSTVIQEFLTRFDNGEFDECVR